MLFFQDGLYFVRFISILHFLKDFTFRSIGGDKSLSGVTVECGGEETLSYLATLHVFSLHSLGF